MTSNNYEPPVVTFGLPAYNSESHLALTLDSLLAQTYPAVRIVISDNASTDNTEAIARDYVSRYDNIEYIRQDENIGAANNFTFLQANAKTPYFAWAGSHDLWHPEFTSRLVEHLEANPSVALAYPLSQYIDTDGRELWVDQHPVDTTGLSRLGSYRRILWQLFSCYLIHGIMRQSILPVLDIPHVISGDHVTIAEIAMHGEIAFINEILFYARVVRPDEVYGSDEYYLRAMKLMTGRELTKITPDDKLQLKRQLQTAHLELIDRSSLNFSEKLLARWQTYYCFDTRWEVRHGPLHSFHSLIKRLVPESLRLKVTKRLLR